MANYMVALGLAAATALTAAVGTASASANSASALHQSVGTDHALTLSAATKKRRVRRGSRYIACTPSGCHPTPPGCYPTAGFEWRGNPTGFDVIVCPGRYR